MSSKVNILVVSEDTTAALNFIDSLKLSDVLVSFNDQEDIAIKNVRQREYDIIIIGDRLAKGDVWSVALEIRNSKNRKVAVIFVGFNKAKAAKIRNAVGPHTLKCPGGQVTEVTEKVLAYLASRISGSVTSI